MPTGAILDANGRPIARTEESDPSFERFSASRPNLQNGQAGKLVRVASVISADKASCFGIEYMRFSQSKAMIRKAQARCRAELFTLTTYTIMATAWRTPDEETNDFCETDGNIVMERPIVTGGLDIITILTEPEHNRVRVERDRNGEHHDTQFYAAKGSTIVDTACNQARQALQHGFKQVYPRVHPRVSQPPKPNPVMAANPDTALLGHWF